MVFTDNNMARKIPILILIVMLLAAGYEGYIYYSHSKARGIETAGTVPAVTAKVQKKDIWDSIETTGEIHGEKEVKVFSDVPGKVNSILKPIGSKVKKNEPIIKIDSEAKDAESPQEKIDSPMKGVITRYFVKEGETVFPDFPLAEIASIETAKIEVQIAQSDLHRVRKGLEAQFYVDKYPDKVFKGRISAVNGSIDPKTRTGLAEIEAPNSGYYLKPGMTAKVDIRASQYPNSLVVPIDAIMFNPGADDTVFVVGSDMSLAVRKVKLGIQAKGFMQVVSGLSEGEKIVTESPSNLREGVKIKEVPKPNESAE